MYLDASLVEYQWFILVFIESMFFMHIYAERCVYFILPIIFPVFIQSFLKYILKTSVAKRNCFFTLSDQLTSLLYDPAI